MSILDPNPSGATEDTSSLIATGAVQPGQLAIPTAPDYTQPVSGYTTGTGSSASNSGVGLPSVPGQVEGNSLSDSAILHASELDNLAASVATGIDSGSMGSGITNAITKGIPLVAASIVNSFANTAIELGNVFGADSQKITVQDEFDDPETLAYYQRNSGLIEGAGLIAGSLLPGTLAIKGLRLLRAGEASAALADATGLLRPEVSAKQLMSGIKELQEGTAAVFPALQSQKYIAIAAGVADNFLEGIAYQTATYGTMKASPVTDEQSFGDVAEGIMYGGLLNGAVGGLIDGIKVNGALKKIRLTADQSTKEAELTDYYGKLNITGGDQLVAHQVAKNNITAFTKAKPSPAANVKSGLILDNITLNQELIATKMADGDGAVGKALVTAIQKASDGLSGDSDAIADKFAALAKISRISTSPTGVPDSTQFFINSFSKELPSIDNTTAILQPSEFNPDPALPNLISKDASNKAVFSRAYQLVDPITPPSIARYSDTTAVLGSADAATGYKNAEAAWKDGHDIFINKTGQVVVNPKAPNIQQVATPGLSRVLTQEESTAFAATGNLPANASKGAKQLFGTAKTQTPGTVVSGPDSVNPLTEVRPAKTILNVQSGDLTNDVTAPHVGDFGTPKLVGDTLVYGDHSTDLAHSADALTSGSPTDANAQYVSWNLRGIKKGDTLDPANIPAMQTLLKQGMGDKNGFQSAMQDLQKMQVRMSDGSELPGNANDLLATIKQSKDTLASNLMLDGKEDLDQIAMRTGVSKDYLINNMQGKQADYLLDPAASQQINHISLAYDIGNTNVNQGMVLKGMQDVSYRTQVAVDAANTQLASFVGGSPGKFPYTNFISTKTAADANVLGSGAGFISQANAGYGTLGQSMELIGRNTDGLIRSRLESINTQLVSHTNALRADPVAAAEANLFVHVRQSTNQSFSPLPAELMAKEFPNLPVGSKVAVLTDSLSTAKDGSNVWDQNFMPTGFRSGADAGKTLGNYNYYPLSPKVAAWEDANAAINDSRIGARNGLNQAQGYNTDIKPGSYYAPPINTSKYKFLAYVKPKEGTAFSDNGVSVIVGRTADELQQKVAALNDGNYSIYFKEQLKQDHQVIGDYDYNRNFSQTQVNNTLVRKGILNDLTPQTRADNLIDDYLNWHQRAETALVRDHVELGNSQLFANLNAMGARYQDSATSTFGPVDQLLKAGTANPYKSYINTALAIGNKENYPLWQYAQQKLSAFGSTAFDMVRSASGAALKGILPYEEASKVASQFGIGNLWDSGINAAKNYYNVANKLPPVDVLSRAGHIANAVLGNGMIRLDAFQQMIHVLASPMILSSEFQSLLKNNSDLVTTVIPGTQKLMPSVTKLMYRAVKNSFDPSILRDYGDLYGRVGVSNEVLASQRAAEMALGQHMGATMQSVSAWAQNAISKVPVLGSNLPQKFIHFVTADVGRQLFEGAGQTGTELETNLSTWMNRIQGNYIASQRQVGFQGPIGAAIGLFQTYQFNVAQQLFRFIEDGDTKAIAVGAAIHGSLFGLQGMPGYHLLNNAIIGNASGNPGHADIYSAANNYLGKDMADWLLYGAISNVTQTGLYTRGDLNPRQLSVLPVNPMQFPAIAGGIKLASSLWDTAQKIASGGGLGSSILLGLEHNGISRPLAGMAQLAQGFSTDAKGNLISSNTGSNYAGLSDVQSAFNMARLIGGGRALDDSIATDALYRKSVYQASTEAKLEALGQTVKTTLYGNKVPTNDQVSEFADQYRRAGGDVGRFGAKMQQWSQEANVAVANKLFAGNKQNPLLQNIQQGMGGVRLPDFRSTLGSFDTASADTSSASVTQ